MSNQSKQSADVIPFPKHLAGLPRSTSEFGHKVPTRKGSIELYAGENGMVLVDACVPMAVAARMLEAIGREAC